MNKTNLVILAIGLLSVCCSRQASMSDSEAIRVSEPSDSISIESIVEEYRLIPVHSDSLIIGELIYVAQQDSMLYSLDSYGTLAATSLISEKTVFARNILGEGPGECIRPQALAVDSECLYIYDLGKMSVSRFNRESMAFIDQFGVNVPSMSIAAASSKIALANLEFHKGVPQVIEVDVANGSRREYAHSSSKMDITYALSPPMVYAYGGSFCFVSAWANTFNEIDVANDTILSKPIRFDGFSNVDSSKSMHVHDDSPAEIRPIAMNLFQNSGYSVVQYVYKDQIYYCFQKEGMEIANGAVAISNNMLFMPRWQSADYLIGTTSDLVTDNTTSDDYPTYVILTKLKG